MASANDITPGELDRRMRDHEHRMNNEHQVIHARIARVAAESVQVDVHERIEKQRDKELADLAKRLERLETRPSIAWGRLVTSVTAVVAVMGLLIQAYSTVKGVR